MINRIRNSTLITSDNQSDNGTYRNKKQISIKNLASLDSATPCLCACVCNPSLEAKALQSLLYTQDTVSNRSTIFFYSEKDITTILIQKLTA